MQCITLYGNGHLQEERQQALLLRCRERSHQQPTAHRAADVFRIGRARCGTAERSHRADPSRGCQAGIRPSRIAVDSRAAFRRLGRAEVDVGAAGIRTIHGPLPVVSCNTSHLSAWTKDRGGRLVSENDLVLDLEVPTRTVSLSRFLGLFSSDSCRRRFQ